MVKWMDITICGWNVVLTCKRRTSPKTGTESLSHQASELITQERIDDIRARIDKQNRLLGRKWQSAPSDPAYESAKIKESLAVYRPTDRTLSSPSQRENELNNLKAKLTGRKPG